MENYTVKSIGRIRFSDGRAQIVLDPRYTSATAGLEGFSHLQVIWWFSHFDRDPDRSVLETEKPYKSAPGFLGTFATRSPRRPNPIALSCVEVLEIDRENGILTIGYIDAEEGTPLLDIKPYTPSLDRVNTPRTPDWCGHWPKDVESSGDFAWEEEFMF